MTLAELAEQASCAEMRLGAIVAARQDSELVSALIDARMAHIRWFDAALGTGYLRRRPAGPVALEGQAS